jgi:uncharacterized protein YprB with RNaseH-like and TPR domain
LNNYKNIILDIETVPHLVDEYTALHPEPLKKDGAPKKSVGKRGGIHALISEVVAVGLLDVDTDESKVLMCHGEDKANCEHKILSDLYNYLQIIGAPSHVRFLTFNGFAYDLPFLRFRGMINKIPLGTVLPREDKKYPNNMHLDLFHILGSRWQTDTVACSLDDCLFGLTGVGKKSDGMQVAGLYADGNLEAISSHCSEDLRATKLLYERMKGNFIFM